MPVSFESLFAGNCEDNLAIPVIDPLHPVPCDQTFSGFLRVEAQHFRLTLKFSPIREYRLLTVLFTHHTYFEMPFDIV